jgi:hypothetical protein
VKESYKQLLELRVHEIVYYLLDNLFVGSSSIGLVYVAEECSSMITAYQQLERGRYAIEAPHLTLIDSLSAQWNPQTERLEQESEEQDNTTSDTPPPMLSQTSASETNISPPVSASSLSSTGDGLRSASVVSEPKEEPKGFLKSPIEWMKKKLSFKRQKSRPSSSSTPSLHSHGLDEIKPSASQLVTGQSSASSSLTPAVDETIIRSLPPTAAQPKEHPMAILSLE